MLTSAGCFESQAPSLTRKTYTSRTRRVLQRASSTARIANLHWFAHARVELEMTYAAPDIYIYTKYGKIALG